MSAACQNHLAWGGPKHTALMRQDTNLADRGSGSKINKDTVAASELAQGCTTNSWMRSDNKHTNHYFQLSDFEEATQIYFSLERRACMARTYRFAAQCQWTRPC
ncbi:unnamed protein product [Cladocopium goreaui]|uniref:Uncharacterized protein n=1 Tax=Cladocopium goreaui TaxID=2562237 RepID=A0A9P1FQQ3_9DINO|nr:unnamed protein product [Cladocopium goreaui]